MDSPSPTREHVYLLHIVGMCTTRAWARHSQCPGLGTLTRNENPAPKVGAPLTLDLLMDHQGEVIHLQDVGELAQCVGQVDLQEKLCLCWPKDSLSELSARIELKPRQHNARHRCSRVSFKSTKKKKKATHVQSLSTFWVVAASLNTGLRFDSNPTASSRRPN